MGLATSAFDMIVVQKKVGGAGVGSLFSEEIIDHRTRTGSRGETPKRTKRLLRGDGLPPRQYHQKKVGKKGGGLRGTSGRSL